MQRTTLGIAINLLILSAAYSQDAGTFTGRILASNGKPVKGARVTLPDYADAGPIGESTTGADGTFTMSIQERNGRVFHRRLPALCVEADGYAATYLHNRNLTVFPKANRHLGDVFLDVGRSYSGRIVDEAGRAITGASVKCGALRHELGHTAGTIGQEWSVTTDSDGRFQTPSIPLGEPYVYVLTDGYLLGVYKRNHFHEAGPDGRLPDLSLKPDKPICGVVKNELGAPMSDIDVSAGVVPVKTDMQGHFVLRGLDEDAHFQLQIRVVGYAFVNWGVTAIHDGIEYYEVARTPRLTNLDTEAYKKAMDDITVRVPTLEITMKREAQIQGRVTDAKTNTPVTISRIVLCTFTRKKDGAIVLDGCRNSQFTQPMPGMFCLSYSYPTAYHLTVSAEGYDDAEAFTPLVAQLQKIDDIVVKMTRRDSYSDTSSRLHQQISGVVTNGAKRLECARAALWSLPRNSNAVNANIIRGRTTVGDGHVLASQVLKDGLFSLDVPFQGDDWYLLVETPRGVVAIQGPIPVGKGENKSVELATVATGGLRGVVSNSSTVNVPLYAVLFSDLGVQYETRVQVDRSFEFADCYPGTYGLKVGCDSILDTEVPHTSDRHMSIEARLELDRKPSQPWIRAKRVLITEGQVVEGISLAFEP